MKRLIRTGVSLILAAVLSVLLCMPSFAEESAGLPQEQVPAADPAAAPVVTETVSPPVIIVEIEDEDYGDVAPEVIAVHTIGLSDDMADDLHTPGPEEAEEQTDALPAEEASAETPAAEPSETVEEHESDETAPEEGTGQEEPLLTDFPAEQAMPEEAEAGAGAGTAEENTADETSVEEEPVTAEPATADETSVEEEPVTAEPAAEQAGEAEDPAAEETATEDPQAESEALTDESAEEAEGITEETAEEAQVPGTPAGEEQLPEGTEESSVPEEPAGEEAAAEEPVTEETAVAEESTAEGPGEEEPAEDNPAAETITDGEETKPEQEEAKVTVSVVITMVDDNVMQLNAVVNDPEGRNYEYQWQVSEDGGKTYSDIPEANEEKLQIELTEGNLQNMWRVWVRAI